MVSRRRPTQAHRRGGCAVCWRGLLLPGFLACATGALAQGILAPPSENYERPAASHSLTTNQAGGIPPLAGPVLQTNAPLQLGLVAFHPHLLYRFIYGDGIPAGPTNHFKTVIQEISPGLLLDVGAHWTLNYTPTLRLYSNNHFPDATDELAELDGNTAYRDWAFKLSQKYAATSAPLLETEALTEQVNYLTVLQVSRQLGSHLSAQVSLNQNFRSASEAFSSQDIREWSITGGLNYQFWSRFGVGLSGAAGYDLITPGADMKFEQVQGTMNWQPGDKLTLSASAGMEDRELLGTQIVNPIFSGSITYRPWEPTAASLNAARSVSPSYFQNDVIVVTSISATLRQQFLQKFSFEVSGGYTTTPFVGFQRISNTNALTFNGAPLTAFSQTTRQDNSTFFRLSLTCPLLKKGTATLFYQESDTTSGLSAFALTSTQVGIELGCRF
jgi:hypothetical protein